ncbi:MAG: hypothetical protein H6611_09665 [Ignavibacteriales bacterium]|nr:hypothetical protein [Ignavibacteriales bacterium]
MRKSTKYFTFSLLTISFFISCVPLNPVNDFFGIHMNIGEEEDFQIVSYNEVDGIEYQNSINMDPKINAWAEISNDEVIIKIVNNSTRDLQLSYTTDQFILITNEKEYYLGKGDRENYFKNNLIGANSTQTLNLELPIDYSNIAYQSSIRRLLRDYKKTDNKFNVDKENIVFIVVKIGSTTILLKRVPN